MCILRVHVDIYSLQLSLLYAITICFSGAKFARGLTCVVPGCLSHQFNKDHSLTDSHFVKFPDQQAEIVKWIKLLKLAQEFEVKTSTRICHLHFKVRSSLCPCIRLSQGLNSIHSYIRLELKLPKILNPSSYIGLELIGLNSLAV